jgi:hypothetical protein
VATLHQAISTNHSKNKVLKEETDSKLQLCKEHEETIDHLTSILAKNEYLMRHDTVCAHLHYSTCTALGIETTDKWHARVCVHTHMPGPVYEQEDVNVLWNQAVHTDREVMGNRSDMIFKNKQDKTCILIGVAIPADRNTMQKEAEKKLK